MIYYINIGVDATGYDGLTKGTPRGFNEFTAMIANPIYAADTFKLRGFKVLTSDLNILYAAAIERWDGFLDYPWRMSTATGQAIYSFTTGFKMEGGITSNVSFYIDGAFQISNCYLYNASFTFLNTGTHSIKGCTIFGSAWFFGNDLSVLIRDTILVIGALSHSGSNSKIVLEHSVINLTKVSINFNELWKVDTDDGHSVLNWSPYVEWPTDAFTVTEEQLILPGVFLKGSSVYTEYSFDLFGNVRKGVGAVAPTTIVSTKEGILFFISGDNALLTVSNSVGEGVL